MRYIVSGKEMKLLDNNTISCFGVPELVLMEQAAKSFVQKILALPISGKGIVFCGTGNNGADGIAIARLFNEKNIDVDICFVKDVWEINASTSNSYEVQKHICEAYGYSVITDKQQINETKYDFVIDAVFGIGLSRELNGAYLDIIDTMNHIEAVHVAVDIPSGINADSGNIMKDAVKCDYTITFSYNKLGLLLWPGNEYAGEVLVADIGITDSSWCNTKPSFACLTEEDVRRLPKRPEHSNKGTYGKLLIVAGGDKMAGAAILSAKAAYRNGVGLVKIFTSEANRVAVQVAVPEAIVLSYEDDVSRDSLVELLSWPDAIVVGPGLGISNLSQKILKIIVEEANCPVLFDADALNMMGQNPEMLLMKHQDWIVTPHLGEFSRMIYQNISWIQNNLITSALDFAHKNDVICVLKDFRTIVANPCGLSYINLSGNNGMATAGSGDVLSGIIGAFLAQGMKSIDAASFGVFIHGLAGDFARTNMGTHAIMATDIVESLKEVWNKMENK